MAKSPTKTKMWENHIYKWDLKQDALPCLSSAVNMCTSQLIFFSARCIFVNNSESAPSIDFGVLNKLWQVGEFADRESANYEDELCK